MLPELPVTGERVSTATGGFNPTWQRHVAAYALCAQLLPLGRVLDVACGVGHSHALLAPRETVGLDIDPAVLVAQERPTLVGDMCALPFPAAEFDAVLSVQAIEHVPDPELAVGEARRVLRPGGVAVFVTPNRLTFGPPGEVIDPYHYIEFSAEELRRLCSAHFGSVELRGIFGSSRYRAVVAAERVRLHRLLRRDPLRMRRLVPRRMRQHLYDWGLRRLRRPRDRRAEEIDSDDFTLGNDFLDSALDLIAICRDQ
jgi:SAM-dependent methyltransferase